MMKKILITGLIIIGGVASLLVIYQDKFTINYSDSAFEDSTTYEDYISKEKLVVVNNWASWCAPCLREIPFLIALENTYGNDVVFLSYSHDRDTLSTKIAIAQTGFNWKEITLYDYQFRQPIRSKLQKRIGILSVNELPYTTFIKNGEVIHTKSGILDSLETIALIAKYK